MTETRDLTGVECLQGLDQVKRPITECEATISSQQLALKDLQHLYNQNYERLFKWIEAQVESKQ